MARKAACLKQIGGTLRGELDQEQTTDLTMGAAETSKPKCTTVGKSAEDPDSSAATVDRIPLFDPHAERAHLGVPIRRNIDAVIESGSFILGPAVSRLETELSDFVHASQFPAVKCVGVASGTDALHLLLLALGVGVGDEVVTTPFTWLSSAEVIPLVGARAVFSDIHARTFCLDPTVLSEALTERTRAVIFVSLFGFVPDVDALASVIHDAERKYGTSIALIEDGAQSFGAIRWLTQDPSKDDGGDESLTNPVCYQDAGSHELEDDTQSADDTRCLIPVRSCAHPRVKASVTSFFPSKPLGCYGDGGAIFTRDEEIAEAVTALRSHGKDAETKLHRRIGLNGRLDALQAAVLSAKIEVFDDMITRRIRAARFYTERMRGESRVLLPLEQAQKLDKACSLRPELADTQYYSRRCSHVYGVYTVRVRKRDELRARLNSNGVATAIYYKPCVHEQPAFRDLQAPGTAVSMPVAEHVSRQTLSLPIHAFIDRDAQSRVVDELVRALDDLEVTQPPELHSSELS